VTTGMRFRTTLAVGALCASGTLGLAACGSNDSGSSSSADKPAATASAPAADAAAPAAQKITLIDAATAGTAAAKAAGAAATLTPKTIGFIDVVGGIDSTVRLRKATEDAAKAIGWKVVYCDGAGAQDKSSACMNTLLSRKVDAVISDGVVASFISTGLREAKSKGIPAIDMGGEVPGYQANYAPDESRLGEVLAGYFKSKLDAVDETPVPIAVSAYAAPWATARTEKLKALVAGDSKLKIVATTEPDQANLVDGSRKAALDQLTANPTLKAFWVDFDAVGQAVGQQVSSRFPGKSFPDKPLVATFHADFGTDKLMKSGAVDAVADVNYDAAAYVAVDQLAELFARKTPLSQEIRPSYGSEAGDLYTYQMVDKDNLPAEGQYPPSKVDVPAFFGAKWKAEFGR
jgi:ABC-type sugar transport system substrate-binding protein